MRMLKYLSTNARRICLLPFAFCLVCGLGANAHANLPEERLDGGFGDFGSGGGHTGEVSSNVADANYPMRDFFGPVSVFHLRFDVEDPMFFERATDLTSRSSLSGGNKALQLMQSFSYGVNNNMVVTGNVSLRNNQGDHESGLSDVGLTVKYRSTGRRRAVKTDVFGGINYAGAGAADLPSYASTVYVLGARMGRQWTGMTLAATVQSSWIFDEENGMAYIDFSPEMYFRFNYGWSFGTNVVFRKATDPQYDQRWAGTKIAKRYGRTVYVGSFDYEFENSEWKIGTRLNLMF